MYSCMYVHIHIYTYIYRDYNVQHHEVLKGSGVSRVIISKEGELEDNKYVDTITKTAVSVDHVKVCMYVSKNKSTHSYVHVNYVS
jgi:hypothetical protein